MKTVALVGAGVLLGGFLLWKLMKRKNDANENQIALSTGRENVRGHLRHGR